MIKNKVIAREFLPTKFPVIGSIVWWLFLDRLQAPSWLMAIVFTLITIVWIVNTMMLARQEQYAPNFSERIR